MKRLPFVIIVFLGIICPSTSRAGPAAVVGGTVPVVAPPFVSTDTFLQPIVPLSSPTIIDAGETISTPTPHPMTLRAGQPSFVTSSRLLESYFPANASLVFPEKTRAFDAQNAGEALSHEVGVLLHPQGSPSYPLQARIRGASANQTLVLIDGRPMQGVFLGPADLSEIPLQQIDHIEIVRGGLSALYGPNALGGVINVISKRATYTGYPISHVAYESGSYSRQTYKVDFGSRVGPVDYVFFGDQKWQSGFRSNSDNNQYNIGGNAGVSMGRGGKIMMDVSSYHNNSGVPGFRCDDVLDPYCINNTTPLQLNRFNNKDEKPASTPVAREVTDSNYIRASYLVDLPHDTFLAVRIFGQQREIDFDNAADTHTVLSSSDRREHSNGADAQVSLPLGFLVGGSFIHDQENFEDRLAPANNFSARAEQWGLFAQETLHWNAFTLIPSGRYDQNSQFGDTANPRVQSFFEAAEWLRFSASAGRSFRAPTFDEVTPIPSRQYIGNADLHPEVAWTYDAGFELHESSRNLRVNYFRAHIENSIQTFVPLEASDPLSPFTAVNLDRARRQGMEIQMEHVVNTAFREALNYTYLENVGIPRGSDHLVSLAYSPRHTVNWLATYTPHPRWSIDTVLRYQDARFSGNDQTGSKMGSQLVADLRLAYQWRQMEVFFGINNVFDKRYVEQPGFPLPSRNAYGGIRLRLWG